MNQTPTLTVYKASAGSGKTFTLAVEYIKLLIQNPMSYRNILAVTFTNKATGEMKQRILSQLYGIWKQRPKSKDYMDRVCADLQVTPQFASDRARLALHLIVYHYSYFRIQTIDTFFQSVLRNLARELDLTANLRVEINDTGVEQQAVDELLFQLKPDDEILRWILSYMREKMDDEEDWNVLGLIKDFGKNIFKAAYKSHGEQINTVLKNADAFRQFKTEVEARLHKTEKDMTDAGTGFVSLLEQHGYTTADFKATPCGYFKKLSEGRFLDTKKLIGTTIERMLAAYNPSDWVRKEKDPARKAHLEALAEGELQPYLLAAEQKRLKAIKDYTSAKSTLMNLNQLRLLHTIERKVRSMNTEANRFLLSDTQDLLHALIQDNDSPFVFEKIGTQLDNIMIDEFQDTSTVQWSNFKVLLEECMSHGNRGNLIVGDVKQSIYRWRDGDWRLLHNIKGEFKDAEHRLKEEPLATNYRSTRRIINFNNAFFVAAGEQESKRLQEMQIPNAELIAEAYKKENVEQKVPEKKGMEGYVRVTLFKENEELDELKRTLEELLAAGVPQEKIAILVRNNPSIQRIAQYLTQEMPGVKLVSDEAFRLDSSLAANMIVAAMHCLTHPDDKLTAAYLSKAYRKYILKQTADDNAFFINTPEADWLPRDYSQHREELLAKPVYDLAERLYDIFQLHQLEGQTAYVCAFFDQLLAFLTDNAACIDDFVEAWQSSIGESTIGASKTDGIRILTIHKSKGLEFEYVVFPFCDWQLSSTKSLLWCSTDERPYNMLPVIPISGQPEKLLGTVYNHDSEEEILQNAIDNLNLLYVAFTRAGKGLFVIGKEYGPVRRSHLLSQTLPLIAETLGEDVQQTTDDAKSVFEYGELLPYQADEKEADYLNVFTPRTTDIRMELTEREKQKPDRFHQSNQSIAFTHSEDESEQERYIKLGNLLHKLFSSIRTTDDAEGAIRQMEQDGLLSPSTITAESLRRMLDKRWATPQVKDWFSGRWRVFNECTILSLDADGCEVERRRPDRVMTDGREIVVVDFKFGTPHPDYEQQVRGYMQLLRDMGHRQVSGYLWFVYTNRIVEVK